MRLRMRSQIVFVLLLAASALAADERYHSLGVECPHADQRSFLHNTFAYNAPLHVFTNVVGSFFNDSWYADSVISETKGKDNVPGSMRLGPSGTKGTAIYNETLLEYIYHPNSMLQYSFSGAATWFAASPSAKATYFHGYTETMRLQSVCGGKATYIDLITWLCSDDQVACDIWNAAHLVSFSGIAGSVGATVMPGDCSVPTKPKCSE
ncbi:hypothetical protein HMN09_00677000 [Mycena chlorophos]|uniref:Uncharacterized protein n=1 Tax=Mycena chlorophos TaxID=658473 RepID=A0A8H6T2K6_MYCCL|nr:hypothetical protein HMN09_00677000 [Mycena chlorophos]